MDGPSTLDGFMYLGKEALQKAVSDRAEDAEKLQQLTGVEEKYKQSEQHVKKLKKELEDYILKVYRSPDYETSVELWSDIIAME